MAQPKKKSDARRITLKFAGKCKACGTALPVGSKVTWYPGGTIYGADCHKSPFATAKPKSNPKSTTKSTNASTEQKLMKLLQMFEKLGVL